MRPLTGTASGSPQLRRALAAALLLLAAGAASAQTTGSYRSRATGFWDQTATWQRYDGSAWVAATFTPEAQNAFTITVRSPHIVTVRNALTTNQAVVDTGAKLVLNAALTLQDGPGDELAVNGTVEVNQTVFVQGASTVVANSGGRIDVAGTLVNEGSVSVTPDGTFVVANGGVYRHARNGGALPPAARTTWRAGATFEMTGFVDALPTNLAQSFHHVTWNAPGQAADADLAGQFAAVAGNLTMTNSGVYKVDWNRTGNVNLAVGGSYIQTGGRFVFDYVGTGTMTVAGNVAVSGGVLWVNGDTGETTLRVRGDVSITGSSVIRSWTTGKASLVMDGGGARSLTASGTFTGEVKVRVESSTQATLRSALVLEDNLEIAGSSQVDAAGFDITIGDDLEVSGALLNPNRVTFTSATGTAALISGTGTVTLPEIVVATDGDPFQLGVAVRVTRSMTVTNGAIDSNGNRLTVAGGGVYRHARNGGALPAGALTTWETGSTCEITGITADLPTNLNHSYYHLTWSNPGQTGSWAFGPAIQGIRGDLTIGSTGTGGFYWVQNAATPLAVGGSYVQTGGLVVYSYGTSSGTMDVEKDVRLSGGTLLLASNTGAPTLRVAGAFAHTGGTLAVSAGRAATVVLDGTAPQTMTATGAIAGENIDVVIDNASGVTAASALDLPDDLRIAAGTLDMAQNTLAVGHDLVVQGGLAGVGRLVFDGAQAQSYSYAAPLALSELVVNKAAGTTLTLAPGAALAVGRGITVGGGTLDLNGQPVTLRSVGGRTATVYQTGSASGLVPGVVGDARLSIERAFGSGGDGWRMIAAPLAGVPYSALNGPFHTQGAEWAREEAGAANLQRLDVTAQDWVALDGADASFSPGVGYIFYMWERDPDGVVQLPAVWTVTGPRSSVSTAALGFNGSADASHNLVGNPWTANLDWDATVAASTDVGTSYAVWDPSVTGGGGMSGYRYYNAAGGTGAAGPAIAPLQGFSVQATAPGATLQFATSPAANDGTPVYQGRQPGALAAAVEAADVEADGAERGPSPHVRLHLEGGGMGEAETYLVFDADARPGRDDFDVDRLTPISDRYATLWLGTDGARLAFDGRPMATGAETFALYLIATEAGTYTLSWPDWHGIPETWRLTLHDRQTGRQTDLRAQRSASFRLDAGSLETAGPARFTLQVTDPARADEAPPPGPDALTLALPQPNPVQRATTLRYAVPTAAPVRLAVFDALGREVAVLVDAERGAGWHEVRWSPALPSGVYFARLVAGGAVQVQTVVVAR